MTAFNPIPDHRTEALIGQLNMRWLNESARPFEIDGGERVTLLTAGGVSRRWYWADEAPWHEAIAYRPVSDGFRDPCPCCGFYLVETSPEEVDPDCCQQCGGDYQ